MPRNVTVSFEDGSQHIYNNVPDDVSPDGIIERAQQEFGELPITNIDGGKPSKSEHEFLNPVVSTSAGLVNALLGRPVEDIGRAVGSKGMEE